MTRSDLELKSYFSTRRIELKTFLAGDSSLPLVRNPFIDARRLGRGRDRRERENRQEDETDGLHGAELYNDPFPIPTTRGWLELDMMCLTYEILSL